MSFKPDEVHDIIECIESKMHAIEHFRKRPSIDLEYGEFEKLKDKLKAALKQWEALNK